MRLMYELALAAKSTRSNLILPTPSPHKTQGRGVYFRGGGGGLIEAEAGWGKTLSDPANVLRSNISTSV